MLRYKKRTWAEEQKLAESGVKVRVGFGKGQHSTIHGRIVGYVQHGLSRDGEDFVVEPLLLIAVDCNEVMDVIHDVSAADKPAVAQFFRQTQSREAMAKAYSEAIWTVQTSQTGELIFPHSIDEVALPGVNAEFPA